MSIAIDTSSDGAISSYSDLVTEVGEWLNRTDLNARIPGFIRLCEARLNRLLRTPEMETFALLTASSEATSLPLDFLAMRSLSIEGVPDRPLSAFAPNAVPRAYSGQTGIPVGYYISNRTIYLAPPPASETTLDMFYFAKLTALTDAMPSNWLLASHPDIYLYGALVEASAFIDDPARVQQWKAAYDESIGELMSAGTKARYGSGPLVPTAVRQVSGARC